MGDLPEDGHVEAETCRRHVVKLQMIVFVDYAIVGLNAVSVYCMEYGKHSVSVLVFLRNM
jgi:hypothetical protein